MCYLFKYIYNLIFKSVEPSPPLTIIIPAENEIDNKDRCTPIKRKHFYYLTDKSLDSVLEDLNKEFNRDLEKELKDEIVLDFRRLFEKRF